MESSTNRIILLGGSAGGLEAIIQVVSRLEANLPAALVVVLHLSDGPAPLIESRLTKAGPFPATFATEGETIEAGKIFIAPPSFHTLIRGNTFHLTRGPRVNRSRPAIDLTFRSAAVAYGSQTIGVILSGMLDDGASGLDAVKRCGGIAIVQHPGDALYADMPKSALNCVQADHTVPATAIGDLLSQIVKQPVPPTIPVPADIRLENQFDISVVDDLAHMDQLGSQVPLGCPECGGPLWEVKDKGPLRYRCHIGHSLSAHLLLDHQNEEIEQSLWVALRTLEEKARMQERLAQREEEAGHDKIAKSFYERVDETRAHAQRMRQLLMQMGNSEHTLS